MLPALMSTYFPAQLLIANSEEGTALVLRAGRADAGKGTGGEKWSTLSPAP